MTGQLPLGSSSVDVVFTLCKSIEFPSEQLLGEISRVLKPGGSVLIYKTSDSSTGESDKVIHVHIVTLWIQFEVRNLTSVFLQTTSVIERKLLLSGFLEAQALQGKSNLPSELYFGVSFIVTSIHWHHVVILLLSSLHVKFIT